MNEEAQLIIEDSNERMEKAIDHFEAELLIIRAGKANPHMLDGILVDYYGVNTPLNQVSNISIPDAKTVAIQPWGKNMIEPIEKAIMQANLGLNPANNGEMVRINIPPLTEERRKALVKQVKTEGENAKVSVRNTRREANDEFKKMQKQGFSEDLARDAEDEVQKLTNKYVEKIDVLVADKEKDIMTI